ncbi:MAG: hypothetical protein KIT35_21070 [Piscinibacter sp.]|uniref:hypothetical protein n=1 Tax=Piscinibacter sp. TaxID=1903157 RepID=UPI002582D7E0|nr:hypothetical protein [Piscinibacter sp.]MCW5666331.1 hypothetical protein [Piscinibacter sp.]
MFYALEWPEGAEPRAWFAYEPADLLAKVADGDALQAHEIWDCASPRELLEAFDTTPEAPGVSERWPGICALARDHGWDTMLYRADHLRGRGHFGPEPVSIVEACAAAMSARRGGRLWTDAAQAVIAFENDADPLWAGAGWKARWALHEQLVATDVLADG